MKTRIEFGSDHVTITCSRTTAEMIGGGLIISSEGNDDPENRPMMEHLFAMGSALERADNFEEEEPE